MVDSEWVTVTEAAKRLNITRTAVYNRIKRGTLKTQTDNHGHQLVNIDGTVTRDTLRHVTHDTVTLELTEVEPKPTPAQSCGLISLDDVRKLLGEQADRLERSHRESTALLMERVDAAECRVEALTEHLMRPWWRRWFGGW